MCSSKGVGTVAELAAGLYVENKVPLEFIKIYIVWILVTFAASPLLLLDELLMDKTDSKSLNFKTTSV